MDDESSALVQIEERTLTWQQTTALLLIEYVVLAILGESDLTRDGSGTLISKCSLPLLVPDSWHGGR